MQHIALPGIEIDQIEICPAHATFLDEWLAQTLQDLEAGDIAASLCLQGAMVELVIRGGLQTDWLGVFNQYLTSEDGRPLSYSSRFGERLHNFGAQVSQATIHATHTRWWIELQSNHPSTVDHAAYGDFLEPKFKAGWIYDHDVSPTIDRHRMKSELTMSMAQATEILRASQHLEHQAAALTSTLCAMPLTGFLGAEYFRLRALENLGAAHLLPASLAGTFSEWQLALGFCDFAVESKIDAYMGTAKRVSRDIAVASPLSACQVEYLLARVDHEGRELLQNKIEQYSAHLSANPLDIQAFQMRDIPIPFGADITPIEVICAAHLIHSLEGTS